MKKHLFLAALALLSLAPVFAQNQVERAANFYAIGQYLDGKIVLRWAPAGPENWEAANQCGFLVERLDIPERAEDMAGRQFLRLSPQPLRPAPAADFEKPSATDDFVAAAYMSLYAERPAPPGDLVAQLKAQGDIRQKAYFFAMNAADMSAPAADLLGLRFEDATAKPGKRYLYRVFPAINPLETGIALDTALVFVEAEIGPQTVPLGLETGSEERKIMLKWPGGLNRGKFVAYYIERAEQPAGPFSRLNAAPYLKLSNDDLPDADDFVFPDSVGVNYRPFYYRLVGITPFGTLSQPSEIVRGIGVDKTPPGAPSTVRAAPFEGKKAKITWKKTGHEPDFRGFIVGRSAFAEGPFAPLHDKPLPPSAMEFIDQNPVVGGRNFYAVTALDTAGNAAQSLSAYALFPDTFPPAKPIGLRGTVDTLGVVRLHWSPNREPDLQGYAIYWANAADHSFIMLNDGLLRDTVFTDTITLSTLTEEVFYRVAAVDVGFGFSELSDILELKRPDRVPPSTGLISNYLASERRVKISWVPSSSHDLASQELWRKSPGEDWKKLRAFGRRDSMFTDENLRPGATYEYALVAQDDDGLRSEHSFPLSVRLPMDSNLPGVDNLRLTFDKEKKSLNLSWQYPEAARYRFVIYRSTAASAGGLMTYESVSGAVQFSDLWLPETGEYGYAVRVVDEAGNESGLSKIAKTVVGE